MTEYKEISDFKIVAALLAKGYAYEDVFKQGSRVSFTFEWDPITQKIEDDFLNHELFDIDALTMCDYYGNVKKIIYSKELK